MEQHTLGADATSQRLDVALAVLESSLTRSAIKSLINDGLVRLNGSIVKSPSIKVGAGDKIELSRPKLPSQKPSVDTLYEDDDVIVLNKPAGILTHPSNQLNNEWTLSDIVKDKIEEKQGLRPGIVHRLDRDTSGMIIVAKHLVAKEFLQKQFSTRQVGKTYQAIVSGQVADQVFDIDMPIARDGKKPHLFKTQSGGKPAQTSVRILNSTEEHSSLELKPTTGRTHQLRVHLKVIGHPIVGDKYYGEEEAPRMYLHAYKLALTLPSGKHQEFTAPLDASYKMGLDKYGLA